jgi:hypothetical protein
MTLGVVPLDLFRWDVDIAKIDEFREVPLMATEDEDSVRLRSALKANRFGFAGDSAR